MNVFDFENYSLQIENGHIIENQNRIQIAYYKDYTLYKVQFKDENISTSDIGNSTLIDNLEEKGKRQLYFVFKKGVEQGLMYSSTKRNKIFFLKDFRKQFAIDFENYSLFNLKFGTPAKIETNSNSNIQIEKFAPTVKNSNDPDSIFCFYDKSMRLLDFSFNPIADKRKGAKLWKIEMIFNRKPPYNDESKKSMYWKIQESKVFDETILMDYFNRFRIDERKIEN